MDFWNTVLGNHLAETLIRCLPEITEKKQNTGVFPRKRYKKKLKRGEYSEKEEKQAQKRKKSPHGSESY